MRGVAEALQKAGEEHRRVIEFATDRQFGAGPDQAALVKTVYVCRLGRTVGWSDGATTCVTTYRSFDAAKVAYASELYEAEQRAWAEHRDEYAAGSS